VDELCRPVSERAQHQEQAVRPLNRRQPVDRRRRRERPLHQAQRLLAKNGIKMDDFIAATVLRLFEWPSIRPTTGLCRQWPYASLDPIARTGSPPISRPSSRRRTIATIAPPQDLHGTQAVAEFFQGREIDGKKGYGATSSRRGSEGITMGVHQRAVRLWFQ